MYHIKHIVKFINGRPRLTGCYEITDDHGLIVEPTASEETMKYYESLNKKERKEAKRMSSNIHDVDKIRRIESVGYAYDGEMKYDEKLFILFDPKTYREIKKKCFYFLIGPTSTSIDHILNRITAKEFDDYMKNPDNSKFRLIPARIERI